MHPKHFNTLISSTELLALQGGLQPALQHCVILDCGFDLADPEAGAKAWAAGHLPTAQYAHLDHDLAGSKTGHNGRHPLPERAAFAAWMGQRGIKPGVQVVTYDAQGSPYAARAWWLLRWMGHGAVAVLDGGRAAWLAAGGVLTAAPSAVVVQPPYPLAAPAMPTINASTVQSQLASSAATGLLLDARAAERFRGDVEPLDPVAGHIPGATNRFFKDNLQPDGRFKPAADLRAAFVALGVGERPVVQQCGSGVTACHNLLAMAHAGLGDSTLYPGSWSEWCSDPRRPVARG